MIPIVNLFFPVQIFLNAIIAWIEGYLDGKQILKGKYPEHMLSAAVRVGINLATVVVVYYMVLGFTIIACALIFVGSLAVYWLFIDLSINITRNKDLFYVGRTAKTDRAIRKISKLMDKILPGNGIDGQHVAIFKGMLVFVCVTVFYSL